MRFRVEVGMSFAVLLASCGGGSSSGDGGQGLGVITASAGGNGRGKVANAAELVRKPLDAANEALERAKAALSSASRTNNADLVTSLDSAQKAVREVARQQEETGVQLAALARIGAEVASQTEALEKDRLTLQQAKSDLEAREIFFKTGFVTALIAFAAAMVHAWLQWPLLSLDKKLRRLEIEEKELDLQAKGKPPATGIVGNVAPALEEEAG